MYKVSCTTGAGAGGQIYGVFVYSPFLRVDTIINGQAVESVNQYNPVCQRNVNCDMDVSGKAGIQYAYGYLGGTIALNAALANNSIN